MGGCGFCHDLHELDLPVRTHRYLWVDTTSIRGGHAGIDVFLGQEYAPCQLERILVYVANESTPAALPPWARILAWYPEDYFLYDADFGFHDSFRDAVCLCAEALRGELPLRFSWAVDDAGISFQERINQRLRDRKSYLVFECHCGFSDECHQDFSDGQARHIRLRYGQKYVRIL